MPSELPRLPSLANILLNHGIDLWLENSKKLLQGDVVLIRYADDMILASQEPQGELRI
jgi:hypothetical protein